MINNKFWWEVEVKIEMERGKFEFEKFCEVFDDIRNFENLEDNFSFFSFLNKR